MRSSCRPLEVPPFPLSSRAKPRDLRFYGPVMEMFLAFADRLRISRVPAGEPINPHCYARACLEVGQIGQPLTKTSLPSAVVYSGVTSCPGYGWKNRRESTRPFWDTTDLQLSRSLVKTPPFRRFKRLHRLTNAAQAQSLSDCRGRYE